MPFFREKMKTSQNLRHTGSSVEKIGHLSIFVSSLGGTFLAGGLALRDGVRNHAEDRREEDAFPREVDHGVSMWLRSLEKSLINSIVFFIVLSTYIYTV